MLDRAFRPDSRVRAQIRSMTPDAIKPIKIRLLEVTIRLAERWRRWRQERSLMLECERPWFIFKERMWAIMEGICNFFIWLMALGSFALLLWVGVTALVG